eukprot:1139704-Pelagomonas_calceolata.AAC.1
MRGPALPCSTTMPPCSTTCLGGVCFANLQCCWDVSWASGAAGSDSLPLLDLFNQTLSVPRCSPLRRRSAMFSVNEKKITEEYRTRRPPVETTHC